MKILYVANHDPHDNDDEISIAYALEQLGHSVMRIGEHMARRVFSSHDLQWADFLLFHKWREIALMKSLKIPKVCWFFDLVDAGNDPTLKTRSLVRIDWMRSVIPVSLMVFSTDGDWCRRWNASHFAPNTPGKMYHLMQGADERVMGVGKPPYGGLGPSGTCDPHGCASRSDLLFMGMVNHGQKRESHITELKSLYGDRFVVFGNDGPRSRRHGRELADVIASTKIVIAPDGPNTDLYWSNRVYITLGFNGFLLHPYSSYLATQYEDRKEIVYYHSRTDLIRLVEYYLDRPDERAAISKAGYERTLKEHTYRHRCLELVEVVKERLGSVNG